MSRCERLSRVDDGPGPCLHGETASLVVSEAQSSRTVHRPEDSIFLEQPSAVDLAVAHGLQSLEHDSHDGTRIRLNPVHLVLAIQHDNVEGASAETRPNRDSRGSA